MTDVVIVEEGFSPVNWWIFILQGLIAVIFGAIAVIWAPWVIDIFAYFIGALIVIYSVSVIIKGAIGQQESGKSRAILIILGIIGIIIGILILLNIVIMWLTLAVFLAIWAFLSGLGDLWLGLTAEKESGWYRLLLIITGIIALAIGFFVIMMPILMQIVLIQVLGLFFIVLGIVSIITGFVVQAKLKE